jgi:hypothetical protein
MQENGLLGIGLLPVHLEAKAHLRMDRLALARQIPVDHRGVTIPGNHGKGVVTIGKSLECWILGDGFHETVVGSVFK